VNWKRLFSRSLEARPGLLHFAAHSHHLWPDASHAGQMEAWDDAARLADRKWDRIMGPVWEEAQGHVARELALPDPSTVVFAPNTHELMVRVVSALPARQQGRKPRVLASDGEFHSFARQARRWAEAGEIELVTASPAQLPLLARGGGFDLVFASHVEFATGRVNDGLFDLAEIAAPRGTWLVIDGYHGFMAVPTDLSAIAGKAFYLAGGYKYAMSGEGVGFLHAPPEFGPRPVQTGWYAAFDSLAEARGEVTYPADARRFLGATFDPSGLYRFNAVQRMLRRERLTTGMISAHVSGLQDRFLAADPLPGMARLSDPRARFLAFQGERAAALHAGLERQGILTDLRGDVLRIGFAIYHDGGDVDRLLAALAQA
jgi:selenocysteine lyase/cysteine desulfurase